MKKKRYTNRVHGVNIKNAYSRISRMRDYEKIFEISHSPKQSEPQNFGRGTRIQSDNKIMPAVALYMQQFEFIRTNSVKGARPANTYARSADTEHLQKLLRFEAGENMCSILTQIRIHNVDDTFFCPAVTMQISGWWPIFFYGQNL